VQISASGLQAAQRLFALHAYNIACATAPDPAGAQGSPDLVAELVGMISAKSMYAVNAKALWLTAETEQMLLDVRA
jgi:flagellar basal body rod protein FlgC